MRKACVVFITLLLTGAEICTAQTLKQSKWVVFGGYTLARASGYPNLYNISSESGDSFAPFSLNGGEGSVTYYPVRHFGLTADFSATSRNQSVPENTFSQTTREQFYLFGPEFRYTIKTASGSQRVSLFAHQLFGMAHTTTQFSSSIECYDNGQTTRTTCSSNPFTMASGGGMDIRVDSHISIRPAQLDYWTQQISPTQFLGSGLFSQTDSSKLGISGLRYSVGIVVRP
jgi:hypothetical protein